MTKVKPTVFALLVGINQYLGDVPALNGCVNDVKAMLQYLEGRSGDGYFDLKLDVLTSGDDDNPGERKPTRQAVIEAFRATLIQAGSGDTALFYFSGHGSQEKAPSAFWNIEPDHLDETLVCYDSRTPGSWDLADKELAVLIAEITNKGPGVEPPHVLVVLDSCHSGSGTRDPQGSRARLAPQDARDRPVESFLPGLADQLSPAPVDSNWFALPSGRHVVLSACRAEESAREKGMRDGLTHGVFSYFILDSLQQSGPALTYRDIFNRTSALVRGQVKDQTPVLESVKPGDIQTPFLGGEQRISDRGGIPYFNIYFESGQGWFIDGGAVHGIQAPTGSEITQLKVFPLNHSLEPGSRLDDAIGDAQVIQVFGTRSRILVQMKDGAQPSLVEAYKAVVVSTPLPPCPVHIGGSDQAAVQELIQLVDASQALSVVDDMSLATLRVTANLDTNAFLLQRGGDLQPLQVRVSREQGSQAAGEVVVKLEHMSTWLSLLELENKQSGIPADAVHIDVFRYDPASDRRLESSAPGQLLIGYDPDVDEWGVPVQVRIRHSGDYSKPLYVMLVDMTEDYAVLTGDFLFGGGTWLHPGEEIWATDPDSGESFIFARVRPELVERGITRFTDVLKLVVSTDASNAHLLAQDRLQVVTQRETMRGGFDDPSIPASSLHRLMQRVRTRDLGSGPPRGKLSDWRTQMVTLTTVCQGGAVPLVETAGARTEIVQGVTVENHAGLAAKMQLVAFEEGKRDLGNLAIPSVFRSNPQHFQPFVISRDVASSRGVGDPSSQPLGGGDAGSSVVVLSEVSGRELVTSKSPLVFEIEAQLSPGESLLSVGYDPETGLYLPVGAGWQEGNKVKVCVNTLPAPTSDSRSVGGSIKLFIHKVVAEKTGMQDLAGKIHRLAWVYKDEQDMLVYQDDPGEIRRKVNQAERILLLLHGMFGDTVGMAENFFGIHGNLAERYDIVLAFDYENINTSIEVTASALKAKLFDDAGLVPGGGKTVHIVAHSLGTQVVRYFIERDEGSQIVDRAVFVGAPNKGTPWAVYEDYAVIGIAAALNGLVALVSGPAAIATLVGSLVTVIKGVEAVDTTLDQLKPGSQFYKILNASGDPHVAYKVIAGNTSLIQYASSDRVEAETNALIKLAGKLTSPATRNALLSLGFYNKPNDIAVSLESQFGIPPNRSPLPEMIEAACDHLSYFNTETGLKAIMSALEG